MLSKKSSTVAVKKPKKFHPNTWQRPQNQEHQQQQQHPLPLKWLSPQLPHVYTHYTHSYFLVIRWAKTLNYFRSSSTRLRVVQVALGSWEQHQQMCCDFAIPISRGELRSNCRKDLTKPGDSFITAGAYYVMQKWHHRRIKRYVLISCWFTS